MGRQLKPSPPLVHEKKTGFVFNPTEKVIDTTILDLYECKLFVHKHDGRKIGANLSKQGSNGQTLINPAEVNFGYGNSDVF